MVDESCSYLLFLREVDYISCIVMSASHLSSFMSHICPKSVWSSSPLVNCDTTICLSRYDGHADSSHKSDTPLLYSTSRMPCSSPSLSSKNRSLSRVFTTKLYLYNVSEEQFAASSESNRVSIRLILVVLDIDTCVLIYIFSFPLFPFYFSKMSEGKTAVFSFTLA